MRKVFGVKMRVGSAKCGAWARWVRKKERKTEKNSKKTKKIETNREKW